MSRRVIIDSSYRGRPPSESFRKLARKLTAYGGEKVVWLGSEMYSRQLLERGTFFPGDSVLKRSYQRGCHGNAARNCESKGWTVAVGYALSGGIWRQHSWNRDDRDRLIETTLRHEAYFGISLTGRAAELFVEQNVNNYPW